MSGIKLVTPKHCAKNFDCGNLELNEFIKKRAVEYANLGICKTYGLIDDNDKILGYYTLSSWLITLNDATQGVLQGFVDKFSIPSALMGKLAVSTEMQKVGVGSGLIKDAVKNAALASEILGIKALALHAKDAQLATYYKKFGFIACTKKPLYLMASLDQLRIN
ncbi:MAG: GNAT family N-acetyltransferase [Opitutus sp.]|nr:GNAT family N-acetyltransferase [Opitutus sp.]MCS6246638.1 GNAT family N-acetyltransferase [Opitutus sp.]MCS6272801.1 GNAT family N-acetyltransferase [Opitutus sp.]MCS6278797.1 GNAT family N-acetyltransferase [Opitutus sp.]MCS6299625.1 GNAT family N-acetyltransferase [Opitutus sp.]